MRRERAVRSLAATAAAAVGALATIGGVALWLERRSRRRFDFAGKVVLITGGSRGLGLVLARGLVEKGARVALMARQRDELDRAVGSVGDEASVYAVAEDVRSAESCSRVVDAVVARFGRLDVLINNAGVILSAPIAETSEADFHALMDVHFWGALRMTRAALPHLVDSQGRIATVCSIGGKIAVPHLSAYCASKFAQAGLFAVLGEELRSQGVTVTTIFPGLMRTGSHLRAGFKGDVEREFQLFALAAGTPLTAIGVERAAHHIVDAIERGQADLTYPAVVRMLAHVSALLPNVTADVMSLVSRVLPDGDRGGRSTRTDAPVPGEELPLSLPVRAAITLAERAATRNNERATGNRR